MGELLCLETTLMNSFLNSESWVYVKLDHEIYVRKRASDLQEGDLVVVQNDSINKTLEEIEPALEQSARYSGAKAGTERTNDQGESTTLLRALLLEGLVSDDPDIEAKIMKRAGADFTLEEYVGFKDKLVSYGLSVEPNTVMNWLKGRTHAPIDPENLRKLVAVNPALGKLADSHGKDTGFYADFTVWSETRSVVRNYIAHRTGEHSGKSRTGSRASTNRQYGYEIGLVVGHFMDEVTEETSAARILKISRPGRDHNGKPRKVRVDHDKIGKGVVLEKLGVALADMDTIIEEEYLVSNTLADSITHISSILSANRIARLRGEDPMQLVTRYTNLYQLVFFGTLMELVKQNSDMRYPYNRIASDFPDGVGVGREIQEEIISKIKRGESFKLRVRGQTVSHLVDHTNRYRGAIPKTLSELRAARYELGILGSTRKALSREEIKREPRLRKLLESQKRYLLREYGFREQTKFLLLHHFESGGGNAQERDLLSLGQDETPDKMRLYKSQQEALGISFYTRPEVVAVLNRLGVGDAIHFFNPITFIK